MPEPFSAEVMDFMHDLSERLMEDEAPEVKALAFAIRPAQVKRLRTAFYSSGVRRAPVGVVFHVPPTNVPTMFAYCWFYAVLTGNLSIVRVSPDSGGVAERVLGCIERLLAHDYTRLDEGNKFVRYGHDEHVSEALSSLCDLRIVWGGDETVEAFRRIPLPPHARELCFANRHSFAVIGADAFMRMGETERYEVAKAVYNDVYPFDQLACASPRIVFWVGEERWANFKDAFAYPLLRVLR